MSVAPLVSALRQLGYDAEPDSSISGFCIKQYPVNLGQHAGDKVDLAVAIDFPLSPPAGIHFRATYGVLNQNNVSQSPKGSDWRYFSRSYKNWSQSRRDARAIIAYINKVLLDA
jgi:hypothetical protein